ncbi:MAG: hypothetical protein NT051_00570 [Candidatus Micrarchaeota archaeon]|nr:hypothetical protein [Candidatus Micrarchaeota archaeon]
MGEIDQLRAEITAIKERNAKVESDKSWETSWSRKFVIFILTYGAIIIYFYAVGLPNPFVNSLVPALAFVISTLSLQFFKNYWAKHIYKK